MRSYEICLRRGRLAELGGQQLIELPEFLQPLLEALRARPEADRAIARCRLRYPYIWIFSSL
uniref:Uncharacterized protein n=1 Tax=Thermogemmatispora argillosa TaxID=2045280 RepID=A0A455SZW7_9CHLR|nr:hypothetical protein KTA_13270 [Thermogemmatispora argillosa]